jgi:hypothetical protein
MTVPTATYQTFQAKGIREDLSSLISDISPEETPFYRMCKKTTSKQSKKEWQLDALDAHTSLNASVQGDDTTGLTAAATTRAGNYHQIIKKGVVVSGTLQAVDAAGREDELVYQLDKRMREVKRDLEASLTSANAATAGAAASVAVMAGAGVLDCDQQGHRGSDHGQRHDSGACCCLGLRDDRADGHHAGHAERASR